jgi:ABC-2 type transport system permease protein
MILRIVVIVSWIPAGALALILALWGLQEHKSPLAGFLGLLEGLFGQEMISDARQYRVEAWTVSFSTFLTVELYIAMLVVLLVGPGLISKDLRFNAMQLYFSRPLRRIDYFVGKLGVVAWFLAMVLIIPSLIAYGFGLAFSLDITILWDTFPLLLACCAYGAVIILSAGALVLALSSLSRNSRYIALFWVALWSVSGIVWFVLEGVNAEQRAHERYHRQEAQMAQVWQPGLTPEEQKAQMAAQMEARRKAEEEYFAEETRASQHNWRPLVSYTGNLSRIGKQLLNTDAVYLKLSKLEPAETRNYYLLRKLEPQYPWYWSAIVLAVLFGFSLCLLNYRVRSLDRLK